VDVLKVEGPVTMASVKGTRDCKGDPSTRSDEAKEHFSQASAAAKKPSFICPPDEKRHFRNRGFASATESIFRVLCGTATWKGRHPHLRQHGVKALEDWLNDQGVKNIKNVTRDE